MSLTGIPSGYADELAGDLVRRFWLFRLILDAGTWTEHNGVKGRPYTVDGSSFNNTGLWLDSVPEIDERLSGAGGIPGCAIELAYDADLVAALRAGPIHNATCELWWALANDGWGLLGGVDPRSQGLFHVSSPSLRYGRGGRVRIELDPPAAVGRRMSPVIGSNACHQQRYPGDTGWAYAHRFQDSVMNWGGQVLKTGGGGGGISGTANTAVILPGTYNQDYGPDYMYPDTHGG